jgi:hypothetical protein
MRLKSVEEAAAKYGTDPTGAVGCIRNFFGVNNELGPGPQGFLVEMTPRSLGRAHYHPVDQFQVFFGAPGATYQKQPVPPAMVHYSDAFTPYGPFAAGEEGLSFFTLRARANQRIHYMPESREDLKQEKAARRGRRSLHADVPPAREGEILAPGATAVEALIQPQADGMAAYLLKAGPGARITAPDPRQSGGQYLCVVDGAVVRDGHAYGRRSLGWVAADEPAPELAAGAESGFAVVVMQFPRAAGGR